MEYPQRRYCSEPKSSKAASTVLVTASTQETESEFLIFICTVHVLLCSAPHVLLLLFTPSSTPVPSCMCFESTTCTCTPVPGPDLLVSDDGHLERLPSSDEPMRQRTNNDSAEDWPSVIHVVFRDRQHLWKGHPQDDEYQVAKRQNIDWNTYYTHPEWSVGWRWTAKLPQKDEEDREKVGDM